MGQFNRGIWNFHLPFDSWPPSLCLHHHFLVERLFSILAEEAGTVQKTKKTNQKTKNPKIKHTSSLGWKSVSVSLIFIHSPESVQRQRRSLWKGHSTALGKFFPKCYHILGVFTSGESSYLQCFEFIHVTIVICYSISEKQSVNEWGENGVCLWVCLALWH